MSKADELFTLLKPLVEEAGYECKEVTFQKNGPNWYLTVYINNKEGISLDDCEKVSRILDPFLDEVDPIEQSYILEVSSPGIDRPLKTDEDLDEYIGEMVDVNLFQKVDNEKNFQGKLLGYDDETITVETSKQEYSFPRKLISKIAPAVIF